MDSMALDLQNIKRYRDYLSCIRTWDSFNESDRERLRQWYRYYYSSHREQETKRIRDYYCSNRERRGSPYNVEYDKDETNFSMDYYGMLCFYNKS